MSFFIDANVFVYSGLVGPYRSSCVEVLLAVSRGEAHGRTSTAALEEVWFLEWSGRAGPIDGLTERAHAVMAPLLPVTDDTFRRARELEAPRVGPNDRIHAATCLVNGIEAILSADSDFDAVPGLRRVDPLDEERLTELLRA